MDRGRCLGFISHWLHIQFNGFCYLICFFVWNIFTSVKRIVECTRFISLNLNTVIHRESWNFMVVKQTSLSTWLTHCSEWCKMNCLSYLRMLCSFKYILSPLSFKDVRKYLWRLGVFLCLAGYAVVTSVELNVPTILLSTLKKGKSWKYLWSHMKY